MLPPIARRLADRGLAPLTLEEWQRSVCPDVRTGSVILARSQSVSVALAGADAPHLAGEAIDRAINHRSHQRLDPTEGRDSDLPRKEVIQPHLPVRLPCYDFVPIADPTFDSSLHKGWATGFGCCQLS